jgi:hypothetical protein
MIIESLKEDNVSMLPIGRGRKSKIKNQRAKIQSKNKKCGAASWGFCCRVAK